jgi:hypothetical protein
MQNYNVDDTSHTLFISTAFLAYLSSPSVLYSILVIIRLKAGNITNPVRIYCIYIVSAASTFESIFERFQYSQFPQVFSRTRLQNRFLSLRYAWTSAKRVRRFCYFIIRLGMPNDSVLRDQHNKHLDDVPLSDSCAMHIWAAVWRRYGSCRQQCSLPLRKPMTSSSRAQLSGRSWRFTQSPITACKLYGRSIIVLAWWWSTYKIRLCPLSRTAWELFVGRHRCYYGTKCVSL